MRKPILLASLLSLWLGGLIVTTQGCVPRTFVRKNPDDADKGVRYYRPKPYLALRPHVDKNSTPIDGYVQIGLEYLPDFSEEYSLHIRSGLGTNATSVKLDQGWNLTSLNVELDSQTDENIEAVGALLGDAAGLAGKRASGEGDAFVVRATNVPLGYYEAVLGERCGRKQLVGFRYVGFIPFAPCPIVACGTPQPFDCTRQEHELYGLVFENGVMTFKHLSAIRAAGEAEGLNQSVPRKELTPLPTLP